MPRHRGSRQRGIMRPREQGLDEIRRDARVRGGWLGHAAGFHQFPGDMEGRVHGGYTSRHFTHGDSSRLPISERIREEALSLERELDSIERTIVLLICLNPEATRFFPDRTERLDRYLSAAKRLLWLDTSGDVDRRKKSLLKTVTSSIAMEFGHLRVWRYDDDARRDYSPASIWASVRRRRGGSNDYSWPSSSSGSFTGTGSTSGASYGSYHTGLGEEQSVQSYNSCSGMISIDRKSSSILKDIAGVMIGSGYEHILRGAFDANCAQLARYIEILDIDNILGGHMEEPRETLLQIWTSAMHISIGFLREMYRQLSGQDLGSFNTLKEDYFLVIAQMSVTKLLKAAYSICTQVDPLIDSSWKDSHYAAVKCCLSKIVNLVMMHQALNYVMSAMLTVISGKTKELIIEAGEWLIDRLSRMFVKLSVELDNLVRSQRLFITNTGVHRVTKYIMHHMRLLVQQKNTIHLMLKGDFKAFGELVTRLIASLEFMLDINSRSLQLQGQQQVFLFNSVHFVLEEVEKNTELGLILGGSWLSRWRGQRDQCVESYLDASWTPVMSSLEMRTRFPTILWPQQVLDKFISTFEMTYNVQKHWKVTDPLMRQMLREAISLKIIPLYRMHMEKYSEKRHKFARYSIEQLEAQILKLFEG